MLLPNNQNDGAEFIDGWNDVDCGCYYLGTNGTHPSETAIAEEYAVLRFAWGEKEMNNNQVVALAVCLAAQRRTVGWQ